MFFCLQTKLKTAVQLQDLLDATRMLVPRTRYCTCLGFNIDHISITCNSPSTSHPRLIKYHVVNLVIQWLVCYILKSIIWLCYSLLISVCYDERRKVESTFSSIKEEWYYWREIQRQETRYSLKRRPEVENIIHNFVTFFAMFGFKSILFCLHVIVATIFLVYAIYVKLWVLSWLCFCIYLDQV